MAEQRGAVPMSAEEEILRARLGQAAPRVPARSTAS